MTSCVFKKVEKNKIWKIKSRFKISSKDVIYGDEEERKNTKRRKVYLHGNYPNYFYERYKKCSRRRCSRAETANSNYRTVDGEVNEEAEEVTGVVEQIHLAEEKTIDDRRLEHVSNRIGGIFKGKVILDIGCNCGVTTFLLSLKYMCKIVNGIDIDYSIINKNVCILRLFIELVLIYSNQKHIIPFFLNSKNLLPIQKDVFLDLHLLYEQLRLRPSTDDAANAANANDANTTSVSTGGGKRPEMESKNETSKHSIGCEDREEKSLEAHRILGSNAEQFSFPFNVYFLCANIFDKQFKEIENKYDVVICFSVLKWIHLNYGDDYLISFFDLIHKLLKKGGYLILEYHREKQYRLKRNERKFYVHKRRLNYTNFDDIARGNYENRCNMILVEKTNFEDDKDRSSLQRKKRVGMFNRTLCIYQKV
ncbi:bicoid-interacting protein BIN3, putative [Plasmodium ovale curtisi]|uniref:RNA methyltransferase n=1 Tax=Plasmodium ovale curtisi TaxID=864141 RepID=A0A1A8X9G1_PLAOA|nr:bicoid-interacting protein BIN3, putative [Plasmodium ovale curtisi]SBT00903.1 bicoid-interacting protein BIN3, putative [Plasmodium ovale curtisi]